jgi:opacity protein-like surface antigen
MQKVVGLVVGSLLAIAFALPAQAQPKGPNDDGPDPETAHLGRYAGIGLLYAVDDFNSDYGGDPSWGFSVRAGSRTNQHVAFGIEADYYNGFDSNVGDLSGFSVFPVMHYYPFIGKIEPYATVGLGVYRLKGDNNTFGDDDTAIEIAAKLGAGVDFYVTDQIGVFADAAYIIADRDLEDFQSIPITLGVKYRFKPSS